MLRSTQNWLDALHSETLTQVSEALSLSRRAANLATSSPFLATIEIPAQFVLETQSAIQTINELQTMAAQDEVFLLPLSRLQVAITDLVSASSPQSILLTQIKKADRDLVRLQNRLNRRASATDIELAERLHWLRLLHLTNAAIGGVRAQEVIEIGEFVRRYKDIRSEEKTITPSEFSKSFDEIEHVVSPTQDNVFILKHRLLTKKLDAENALFRIRDASDQITALAAQKVADAETRLQQAQDETSQNLDFAQIAIAVLALLSLIAATTTAVFISRYVTTNLKLITGAMRRLAAGQTETRLYTQDKPNDEIGQLFDAFRVFRANAQKLERHSNQIIRQNALFARVFNNINDGVAILASSGRIDACNANVRAILRLPVVENEIGSDISELLAQSLFTLKQSAVEPVGFEEYVDLQGNIFEIRKSQLVGGGSVWLFSETTERQKINDRLEEIRRVETLGKVTGEVAHDFGNILSTISGNLHLLETEVDEKASASLARIRTAVDLGTSLTERLLAFARKQHLDPVTTEITELLLGLEDLLSIALPATIDLSINCADAPLWSKIDPGQLESAILNLCVNAGQSIEKIGFVAIEVSQKADVILISVTDNGCGMSPETVRRAAEPFFSSQSADKGTGLGLSMVHGFVHQSGGILNIRSTPGKGTTVELSLPAYKVDAMAKTIDQSRGMAITIDDEPRALKNLGKILVGLGYEIIACDTFAKGQSAISDNGNATILITDLNLDGGRSGLDLAQTFLSAQLEGHCVVVSSRLPKTSSLPPGLDSRLAMLAKPITAEKLTDAIMFLKTTNEAHVSS